MKKFDLCCAPGQCTLTSFIGHLVLMKAFNFSKNAQSVGPALRSEIRWVIDPTMSHQQASSKKTVQVGIRLQTSDPDFGLLLTHVYYA